MKKLISLLLCIVCITANAQTKRIAFKSHSGNMANFNTALENNLFDMDNSNFGAAPQRDIVSARLDSLIFVSDSVAILVTSEYCTRTERSTARQLGKPRLWKAGRELVYSHPLFSRNHSLDSIKQVITSQYHFKNTVNNVVFVGYDNKKKKYKPEQNMLLPVLNNPPGNDNPPFDAQVLWITGLIILLSLLGGLLSWKYKTIQLG